MKKILSSLETESSVLYTDTLVVGFRTWKPLQSKLFSIAYDTPAWHNTSKKSVRKESESFNYGISGFFELKDTEIFKEFIENGAESFFGDVVTGVVLGYGNIRVTDYDWEAEEVAVIGLINQSPKTFGLTGHRFNAKEAIQWVENFRKQNKTVYEEIKNLKNNLTCADICLKQSNKNKQVEAMISNEIQENNADISAAPALGFRSWKLKNNRLHSVMASVQNSKHQSGIALSPGENKAACYPLSFSFEDSKVVGKKHHTPSPDEKCSCGFYAFHSYSELNETPYSAHSGLIKTVSGSVAGAGNMLLYKNGWRAEKLQVLALFSEGVRPSISPSPIWLEILFASRFYGVPLFSSLQDLENYSRQYAKQAEF